MQKDIEDILRNLARLICPSRETHSSFSVDIEKILIDLGHLVNCAVGSIYVITPKNVLEGLTRFGYENEIKGIEYKLGKRKDGADLFSNENSGGKGGGITAFVATTGVDLWFNSHDDVKRHPAWAGKIDSTQWSDGREFKNCGILSLIVGNEIIGVLKMENISDQINDDVKNTIIAFKPFIAQALDSYRKQIMPGEIQYIVTHTKAEKFEEVNSGDIQLEHLLTSICTSDTYYFRHQKSKEKLSERLPLVLGHETVAIVREVGLNKKYKPSPYNHEINNDTITIGDHVVVIPQVPCGKCKICEDSDGTIDKYGENYCENVQHMASNMDGSLRTKYSYDKDLLIKYDPMIIPNELAVLTEPFAQMVQVLRELGFEKGQEGFRIDIHKFNEIALDNAFRISPDKFDEYFKIFASNDQTPRLLLRLPFGENLSSSIKFSHYALMRRGLFLSAYRGCNGNGLDEKSIYLEKKEPYVLILGTGASAYIAALLICDAYGLSKDHVYIYGRRDEVLNHFSENDLGVTINVKSVCIGGVKVSEDIPYIENPSQNEILLLQQLITDYLEKEKNINFDIIIDCAGGKSTENLISFALNNIANKGMIALFGLSDDAININFQKVINNEVTFKGFFRACRGSYFEAMNYLSQEKFAKKASVLLCGCDPEIVSNTETLESAFKKSYSDKHWGKVLVKLSDTIIPITTAMKCD